MRTICPIVLVAAAGVVFSGVMKLSEDKPLVSSPGEGSVSGRITLPDKPTAGPSGEHPDPKHSRKSRPKPHISGLCAISRITGITYMPKSYDSKTGRFVFVKLPGDARYDICFRAEGGRAIEGIDLDFVDQRLIRLAEKRRKQLVLKPPRAKAFTNRDVKDLLEYVKNMEDFMEQRRVIYIRGHGPGATMLVELMRTRKFHASKPAEYVWRIELWYFVERFGGWERLANQRRLLRRVRTGARQWRTISVEYFPALSVYVDPKGHSRAIEFKLPPRADISRGRIAGTDVQVQTKPHVSGLDSQPPPATMPSTKPTRGDS